jgi:hypothetical protein
VSPERTQQQLADESMLPPWLGGEICIVRTGRRLCGRMSEYYRALFPDAPPDLDHVWPV